LVLGTKGSLNNLQNLALDRIQSLEISTVAYRENKRFDMENYYQDVIGVTVSENVCVQEIHIAVNRSNAPYVITKPLHYPQKVIEKGPDGIVISINVQQNFELERVILGFGESMKVLKPERLRKRIKEKLELAVRNYVEE